MDIKEINSQINAVKGRLEQAETDERYSDEERASLIDKYVHELSGLQQKKEELELEELENQNTGN